MYGDLDNLKKLLAITDDSKDEILTLYLNAATAYIDSMFGGENVFNADVVTEETFTEEPYSDGFIMLPKLAAEIISVTDENDAEVDYAPYPAHAPFYGLDISGASYSGRATATYKPGLTKTPPDDIILASLQIAAHWYKLRLADSADAVITLDGVTIQRSGIPITAASILKNYANRYGKVEQ